jgi:hypothetical protein
MSQADGCVVVGTTSSGSAKGRWMAMSLVALLAVGILVTLTEFLARDVFGFTESPPFIQTCMGPLDPVKGAWARPNSVCWDKKYETQPVEYRFNHCGHRTEMDCASKAAGAYRIVLVGSSFAMGHLMKRDDSFAALLPSTLSSAAKHDIELYNEGMVTVFPHALALRFDEVLAARPDLILWTLSPTDIEKELADADLPGPPTSQLPRGELATIALRVRDAFASRSLADALRDLGGRIRYRLSDSAAGTLALHLLYESQSQYIKSYLAAADDAGFLRIAPSPRWQTRLQNFENDVAEMARQSRRAGIPIVAVLIPNRAQAAIISTGLWPEDIDPYKLGGELRDIITRHGGMYLDILPKFRALPNAEQYYFPVDAHPNARGHRIIADLLEGALTNGSVPPLAGGKATASRALADPAPATNGRLAAP